jgi:formylmethanofuran dehydrogenase subunit E
MSRERRETELGEEVTCAKCGEFWPADKEFFYFSNGKPHSWCKACYVNDPKMIAKKQRWLDKSAVQAGSAV